MTDYYLILGLDRTASQEDIKKAFRRLAMEHHPDRGGDSSQFHKINEAYETLSNETKKKEYDNPSTTNYRFNSQGSQFDDVFREFFRDAYYRPTKNADLTIAATISLKDVISGKDLIASYKLKSGREETVEIKIPPGVENGNTMRYVNLGDDHLPNVPRGDLYVKIRVVSERNWERSGADLLTSINVNALDMIIGTTVTVTGLDDKAVKLTIPAGTQNGTVFGITDHGLPLRQTSKRGRLLVKILAQIPRISDENLQSRLKDIRDESVLQTT